MNNSNKIFIITGEVRSGKTLLISNVISELRKLKVKVTGVYSPARFEDGVKTGIYLDDISSQEKRLLANFVPGWDPENPKREWKMVTDVLQWGGEVIQESVPTSVLIIDELGFLEFEKNQGWTAAFEVLENGDYGIAIVVVRSGLLKKAISKWETSKVIHMDLPSQCNIKTEFLVDQVLAIIAR
jgi:nucleoside-triphosphatase THEP1